MATRKGQEGQTRPLSIDDFRAANHVPAGECALGQLMARLSPDERAAIVAAFRDSSIQATAIHRILRDRYDYPRGVMMIQRHRNNTCQACRRWFQ